MKTDPLAPFLRPALLVLLAAVPALRASPPARTDTRWATLQAIHALENPFDRATPGPCGELGAYQFRSAVWRRYTNQPFRRALDREVSDEVAVRHYDWLRQDLLSHGVRPTAYNIALAWNGGVETVLRGRPCPSARDYAQRAANLAAEFDGDMAAAQ